MSRRELFLEEMGLGPVWRLRQRAEAGDAPTPALPRERGRGNIGERGKESDDRERGAKDESTEVPDKVVVLERGEQGAESRAMRIARMDWTELKSTVASCSACGLCKTRTNTVFGVGDECADWMIVGEAPGSEEDERGEPFVGQAGRLLDSMMAAIGLKRGSNLYIANVLKCRPPKNRNPEPSEVAECSPHLIRQIQLVQPKLILALGRFAAQTLLNSDASIASMRGKVYRYQGVPTIVSYHPAYLLRNLPDKAKAWEDLCFARRTFASLHEGSAVRNS